MQVPFLLNNPLFNQVDCYYDKYYCEHYKNGESQQSYRGKFTSY